MDAKPQRALRPQPTYGQTNNENVAPAMYNMNQQRGKPAGAPVSKEPANALKYNTKRAAFGDVSNVQRALPDPAIYAPKSYAPTTHAASVLPSSVVGKENNAQTAGIWAPAQRAKTGVPTLVDIKDTRTKTQVGATRKENDRSSVAAVNTAVLVRAEPAPINHNIQRIKQSPRHHKSQPCLKNTGIIDPQQKKVLRRTLSRLPVDRSRPKEAALAEELLALDDCEFHDASDVPFADGVEDLHSHAALMLENIEIHSTDAVEEAEKPLEVATRGQMHVHMADEEPDMTYLEEIPAPPAHGVSEADEPWDEDADFYDDQGYTTAHSFRSMGENTTSGFTTILMPRMTTKTQNELDLARAIVETSLSPEEIDDEAWDISMVAEYGDDINSYMKELEERMLPSPHYMDMQTEIQWSMRSVLMEWLIQVHARFSLLPETLFLTVNYIDRFLSSKIVSVNKLQLVGATAIFIASKYEEIICPSIQEIVYMVDGGYTAEEILKAERFMLSMLGFELGWPGPMSFLRRISKADDYDLETRTLAKYFLEVTIMDERFVACPASFLAAGAHCVARLMLRKGDWSMAHTHYSGYTWSQVRPLAHAILQCCRDPRTHHAAVYEKYASDKFKKASIFVEEELLRGFSIPPLHMHRYRSSLSDSLTESADESVAPLEPSHVDITVQA